MSCATRTGSITRVDGKAARLAGASTGRCDPHPFGNLAHDHGYRVATLSLLLRAPLYARGYVRGVTVRAMVSADAPAADQYEAKLDAEKDQNGADGLSDVEGKAVRVAARECGKRPSFKARASVPQF